MSERKTAIHWTELPEDTSGGPLATESNVYRREIGRLLAEGHEGRWVFIRINPRSNARTNRKRDMVSLVKRRH